MGKRKPRGYYETGIEPDIEAALAIPQPEPADPELLARLAAHRERPYPPPDERTAPLPSGWNRVYGRPHQRNPRIWD